MIVLDASVLLKWFFPEEESSARALEYRERHRTGQETIVVPDLLPYEIGNVLACKTKLPEAEVLDALTQLFRYELSVIAFPPESHLQAAHVARRFRISVYDAAYLHLAEKKECPFVTADAKLWRATRSLPFVHLLK